MKKCLLFFLLLFSSHVNALVPISSQDYSTWGARADTIIIDKESIPTPPLSKTKKALVTLNHFGFDVLTTDDNWVTSTFLNDIKLNDIVMDVGSGYGALTRQALKKGAIVISNDLSQEHLLNNLRHIDKAETFKLYLNSQDIRNLDLKPESLNLIIFHRVLHFFKGKEIENILTNAYRWLKPGGKIYIVMMSKDHIAFKDNITYDSNQKWPGENLLNVEEHLPDQAYALPKTLHVISPDTLKKNVEFIGFKIDKVDYISLRKFGTEKNRDGREAVGIIATKNH